MKVSFAFVGHESVCVFQYKLLSLEFGMETKQGKKCLAARAESRKHCFEVKDARLLPEETVGRGVAGAC